MPNIRHATSNQRISELIRTVVTLTVFTMLFPSVVKSEKPHLTSVKQVIQAETILNAGVSRISDIFRLIDGWNAYTVDGYRWFTGPDGVSTGGDASWILMIDGQRIDCAFFSVKNIDMLPVIPSMIDSVEVIGTPGLSEGEFIGRGLIHVHTRKIRKGVALRHRYATANETGDPGPYRYTHHATENIDQVGPDNATFIDAGNDRWKARIGLKNEIHAATDPAVMQRSEYRAWENRQLRLMMPSLNISTTALPGEHHLLATGAYTGDRYDMYSIPPEKNYRTDLAYIAPLGDEKPVETSYTHIGVNGFFPLPNEKRLLYRSHADKREMDTPRGIDPGPLDWTLDGKSVTIAVAGMLGGAEYEVGTGYDRRVYDSAATGNDYDNSLWKLYGSLNRDVTKTVHRTMDLALVSGDSGTSFKTSLTHRWKSRSGNTVSAIVSFSERLPEEDREYRLWATDKDILSEYGVVTSIPDDIGKSGLLSADVIWHRDTGYNTGLEVLGFARYHTNATFEELRYSWDAVTETISSPLVIRTGIDGGTCGGCVAVETAVGGIRNRMSFNFQTVATGDKTFRNEWSKAPDYRMGWMLEYSPVRNFSLCMNTRYEAETTWREFRYAGNDCRWCDTDIDNRTSLDISARKWVWKRRITGSISVHNVLNSDVKYHPLGAGFDRTLLVQFVLLLGLPEDISSSISENSSSTRRSSDTFATISPFLKSSPTPFPPAIP